MLIGLAIFLLKFFVKKTVIVRTKKGINNTSESKNKQISKLINQFFIYGKLNFESIHHSLCIDFDDGVSAGGRENRRIY